MKILFNASTNIEGGAVKNAAIFIKYAIDDSQISWVFALPVLISIIIFSTFLCRFVFYAPFLVFISLYILSFNRSKI